MIQTKLLLIEYKTINSPILNQKKLKAIRSIRNLLMEIDFNSEKVPLDSTDKLQELLSSLKGRTLTIEESKIAEELIVMQEN